MTNYVTILLDETGSMAGEEKRVIGGVNEYLKKLKAEFTDEDCPYIRINLFDSERWDTFYDGNLRYCPNMELKDYNPGAMTPLYDAIAKAVSAHQQ